MSIPIPGRLIQLGIKGLDISKTEEQSLFPIEYEIDSTKNVNKIAA